MAASLAVLVAAFLPAATPLSASEKLSASENGLHGASAATRSTPIDAPSEPLRVVVTTSVWGDVVESAFGDLVDLSVVMPDNADPHHFAPSVKQAADLERADLIVANGAGLEVGLAPAIDGAETRGVNVFVIADHVATLPIGEHAADEHDEADKEENGDEHGAEGGDEHGHEAGGVDPHIWFDPVLVSEAVTALATELEADGITGASTRAAEYISDLADLNSEIAEQVVAVPVEQRKLVTNHDSFGYFAHRYGFEVIATIIDSVTTDAEPSAAALERVAAQLADTGVPAVFLESNESIKLAEAVIAASGSDVEIVELVTAGLGDSDSYLEMMRANTTRIVDALDTDAAAATRSRGSGSERGPSCGGSEQPGNGAVDFLTEPFACQISQRALMGGLVAATIAALVGTWVVVRGMSFFGDALAHGVLPGLAIAAVVGFSPTLGAVVSAGVMVVGINLVRNTTKLSEDTSIGLLFVGMLAIGVVILSRGANFAGDLTTLLFGDVLAVQTSDIVVGLVATVVTAALLFVGHRSLLALAVNPEKAEALGLRPRLTHGLLLTLLAVSVVVSFRVAGTLLVFGLLIAPPATAIQLVNRIPRIMGVAVLFGWGSVLVGLVVSYHLETAASATIVAVAVIVFFIVLAINELRAAARRRHPGRATAGANAARTRLAADTVEHIG